MFQQLTIILNRLSRQPPSPQQIGQAISHLKTIDYFYQLNELLGTDYLIMILPTIETYILRQTLTIIDQRNQHILVEGHLNKIQTQFLSNKEVEVGKLLDLKEVSGVVYKAQKDCKMLRIKKSLNITVYQKKILKMEREQNNKRFQLRKKFQIHQNKQKRSLFEHISIMGSLGELDFQELVDKSMVKSYKKGAQTHLCGEDVAIIGYVFSGKIKITFNKEDDHKIGKFMRQQNIMTKIAAEKQWLCLQQHLWNERIHSNGIVNSLNATILWIPQEIFQAKFNIKSNYSALNRLRGILMTKKLIFDRSFNTREKNLEFTKQQQQSKQVNNKIIQKMFVLTKKRKVIHLSNKQQTPVLQTLMHKVDYKNTQMKSLPKLPDKICLFPDQYQHNQKFKNQNYQLKQMERTLKNIPSSFNSYSENHKFCSTIQSNPESFYKTVMQQCAIDPKQTMVMKRAFTLQKSYYKQPNKGFHYNKSIYNNFKVPHLSRGQDKIIHSRSKLEQRMMITKFQ